MHATFFNLVQTPPFCLGAQPFDWRGEKHDGLKYADILVGKGKPVELGSLLSVRHCAISVWRGQPSPLTLRERSDAE